MDLNDMVLRAKWSEVCGAKTPMMERKGDKSLKEESIALYKYKYTNTSTNLKEGSIACTNTNLSEGSIACTNTNTNLKN